MKSGMIDAEQEKRLSMNIEYLKYFAELAKLQHYGKAAKALNISQPGLSHAIKTLEDEYGVPLFQKEGRNVSLSRYGKELMQDVEEILDAYLRMEERAAGLRTEEKTVRIGTVYPLAAGTIPMKKLQKLSLIRIMQRIPVLTTTLDSRSTEQVPTLKTDSHTLQLPKSLLLQTTIQQKKKDAKRWDLSC